ncbi:MAG: methyltransferase [Chitinophagales bacterium]|nr:methyltransferase [Chitinophagales bacterium]
MAKDKSVFRFKKFEVRHAHSSMKVGTDGVLLAPWVVKDFTPQNILDIGTGSGLIALILAQRFPEADIEGIDIHTDSIRDALYNQTNFSLPNHLKFNIIDYKAYPTETRFDYIVSNPPYFSNVLLSGQKEKDSVRHQINLSLEDLIKKTVELLNTNGHLALILPSDQMERLILIAKKYLLHPIRICEISSFEKQKPIRIMTEFSLKNPAEVVSEKIHIYEREAVYSEVYKNLTKDFYLKF